jgi:hypothetical protein
MLIFFAMLFFGCQQEFVPEITLNSQQQALEMDNRIFQEKILFEAPLISHKKVQVYIYAGSVHHIKQDSKGLSKVRLDNSFKKPFLFEADTKLRDKISPKMDLIVRYYIKNGRQHLIEIRKKTL